MEQNEIVKTLLELRKDRQVRGLSGQVKRLEDLLFAHSTGDPIDLRKFEKSVIVDDPNDIRIYFTIYSGGLLKAPTTKVEEIKNKKNFIGTIDHRIQHEESFETPDHKLIVVLKLAFAELNRSLHEEIEEKGDR